MEPSRRVLGRALAVAAALLVLAPATALADPSPPLSFPATAEVTVVQGSSADFTVSVDPTGTLQCTGGEPFFWFDSLYSLDAAGDVAVAEPAPVPVVPPPRPVQGKDCTLPSPTLLTLTATAAADTPVGDYSSVLVWGKGDPKLDHSVNATALTIHVVAPETPVQPPPPPLVAPVVPPAIVVLGQREAPHPTLGKTLLLAHVKGRVTYREPGQQVQALGGTVIVPNGTTVDATKGVVKVTVQRDATGALDSVDAWKGSFVANQVVQSDGRGLTTFTLADPLSAAKKQGASAARAALRQVAVKKRSLWVNGKGNFKTRGKRASAIVRGTYWVTTDTPAGTVVQVKRGLVAVRDFVRHRTVLVSTGHQYTARPRTHTARRIPVFTGSVRGKR